MTQISLHTDREVGGIDRWWWIDSDIQTFPFIKQDWETVHLKNIQKYMEKYDKGYDTVVQAGGNCGMYPRLLSTLFKHVYTFEPDPANFLALTMNCNNNNIYKTQAALGATSGLVTMHHRSSVNVGMHQVRETEQSYIPMLQLDSFTFRELSFLWLDIEEYEIYAFKGAANTILKHNPLIFCENPTEEIQKYLFDLCGYKLVDRSGMDGIFYYR